MNECKNCGKTVAEGETLCTECSAAEPETIAEATGLERPAAKKVSERTKFVRAQFLSGALLIVAAIAVLAVVYMTKGRPSAPTVDSPSISVPTTPSAGTTDSNQTAPSDSSAATTITYQSFTKDPSEVTDADKLAVVATCAGVELNNQMLSYYYWYAYSTYYGYLSSYGVIDPTLPLDQQACYFNQEMSWQEYFIQSGISAFTQFTLLNQAADKVDFALPEAAQKTIDTLEQTLQTAADEGGFESIDAYLKEYYGGFSDFESYRDFMATYYRALNYDSSVYDSFEYTDEQVSAYYDEHADAIGVAKDDALMINVRHILIAPETVEDVLAADGTVDTAATEQAKADAMSAAKVEAETLYNEWLAGEATEEAFGELAYMNSDDPGSYTNGGLYEGVFPGEMVVPFNDWCFDPARAVGDHGIVETDYGYHLMYFAGFGETSYWHSKTVEVMVEEDYNAHFEELMAGDDTVSDLTIAVLLTPPAMEPAG